MASSKENAFGQGFEATENSIDEFFKTFNIPTLLHSCGIRKRNGYGVAAVLRAIFALPFAGKNFYRGIALKESAQIGKDSAYDFLSAEKHNWRKLLLGLFLLVHGRVKSLTDADRDVVLIADDSPYERPRAKRWNWPAACTITAPGNTYADTACSPSPGPTGRAASR